MKQTHAPFFSKAAAPGSGAHTAFRAYGTGPGQAYDQPRGQSYGHQPGPRDWTRPTNAVPGVTEDVPRERARVPRQAVRSPVLTLRGFGGRTRVEHLPLQLHSVPGVGEEPGRPVERTQAAEEDSDRARAVLTGQSGQGMTASSLHLHRRILASASRIVSSTRQAGAAVRALCQELLTGSLHTAEQAAESAGARVQAKTSRWAELQKNSRHAPEMVRQENVHEAQPGAGVPEPSLRL